MEQREFERPLGFCIKEIPGKIRVSWVMVLHGHRDGFCYSSWNHLTKKKYWAGGHWAWSFESSVLAEMLWFKSVMSKKQNQKGETKIEL